MTTTPPLPKKTSRMLVRVLGNGEYEGEHAEEAKAYACKRREDDLESMSIDENAFQRACQLQLSDVKDIWQNGATYKVVPPQCYEVVMTLDRSDNNFRWACDGKAEKDPEFMGCFYDGLFNDTAVTGSREVWYKVTPTLVEWATAVDEEARGLASADETVVDDDDVASLKHHMQKAEAKRDEAREELRRLQDRVEQQQNKVDDFHMKIAKRKASLVRQAATDKPAKRAREADGSAGGL